MPLPFSVLYLSSQTTLPANFHVIDKYCSIVHCVGLINRRRLVRQGQAAGLPDSDNCETSVAVTSDSISLPSSGTGNSSENELVHKTNDDTHI